MDPTADFFLSYAGANTAWAERTPQPRVWRLGTQLGDPRGLDGNHGRLQHVEGCEQVASKSTVM